MNFIYHAIHYYVTLKIRVALCCGVVAALPFSCFAQIVRSEVPYYSLGSGIGISAKDSLFLLNIRFRIQNRMAYTSRSASDLRLLELQTRIQRLRLRLDGFFYKPELIYVIQLAFSESDMNSDVSRLPAIIKDAVIFYRFNKNISIGLGQTNLPRNRQSVMSSGDLQFVDRSLINSTFNIDRDFGLQAYYYNNFDQFYYALRTAVSSGEGSNALNSNEGLAYTARMELLPLGKFKNNGDYFEADLEREEKPKVSMGFTYNFNKNATRTGNRNGRFLYEPRDLSTFMLDGLLKYQRLSFSMEYISRRAKGDPVTENAEGEVSYIFVGSGQHYQVGYNFKSNFELAARFAKVSPDHMISSQTGSVQAYTLGASRYIKGHRLKIQSDLTYTHDKYIDTDTRSTGSNWQLRLQVELGI